MGGPLQTWGLAMALTLTSMDKPHTFLALVSTSVDYGGWIRGSLSFILAFHNSWCSGSSEVCARPEAIIPSTVGKTPCRLPAIGPTQVLPTSLSPTPKPAFLFFFQVTAYFKQNSSG